MGNGEDLMRTEWPEAGMKNMEKEKSKEKNSDAEAENSGLALADVKRLQQLVSNEYVAMINLLARGADIGDIESHARKILGNPMIITDESYKVLAYSRDGDVRDPVWQSIVSHAYSPADFVEQTDVDNFWQRLESSPTPLFVDDKAFQGLIRRAVAKIKVGAQTKGYIALLEYEREITSLDLMILRMLAEVLSVKINEKDTARRAAGQLRDEFSSDLLTGNMRDGQMIENRARSLGLRFGRFSSVLAVRAADGERYIGGILDDLRSALRPFCRLCIYTAGGSYAFYIASYDDCEKWEHFLRGKLEEIMGRFQAVCAVSLSVAQLTQLSQCYRQVKKMSELLEVFRSEAAKEQSKEEGKEVQIGRNVYSYSLYAPLCLIHEAFSSQDDGKTNGMSRAYKALLERDKAESSEYISTLRVYFSCNQNVAETAKRLFLHRNTVNYRLNKIRELVEDDFDDYRIRLHLQLSILADDLKQTQ